MANKKLFNRLGGAFLPVPDAVNEAGGAAYALTPRQALAQYAATGCLNGTFYANATTQLETVLRLADQVDPAFVAKVAIHARGAGFMKDLPALLLAWLAAKDVALCKRVFPRVCDNARMVRTFVQILRSGVTGRRSLGTAVKKLVQSWIEGLDERALLAASVGSDPSLADLVKMVHPKPRDAARRAAYAWLIGKDHDEAALPPLIRAFEVWKRAPGDEVPDVHFQLLTGLPLSPAAWRQLAERASWQATRMNLATFARHGVFASPQATATIAARLCDAEQVTRARVFPYQLMVAYTTAGDGIPALVREALQDAMEHAIANVPALPGGVVVCPDVSGSMHSPVTGRRGSATTAVRCIDVAGLMAAAVLRRNPQAAVIPFSDRVVPCRLNPRDSVLTNAATLAQLPSGGTDCAAPLVELNRRRYQAGLVILVSDNESWLGLPRHGRGTRVLEQWQIFAARNPGAKLVCLDLQPYATTQAPSRQDILNIGGFGDAVFSTIAAFVDGGTGLDHWVERIQAIAA